MLFAVCIEQQEVNHENEYRDCRWLIAFNSLLNGRSHTYLTGELTRV